MSGNNRNGQSRSSHQNAGMHSQGDMQSYSRYSRQGASPQDDYSRYSRRSMGQAANATNYQQAAPVDPRYSRNQAAARHQRQRKAGRNKKIVIAVVGVLIALLLLGGAAAYAYFKQISDNLHQGISTDTLAALGDTKYTGDAFYMLMLGTDGAWWRDEDPEFDGVYRTDSMMLVRVDPKKLKVSMVSLQRDTLVDMGVNGEQKLNAAYTIGQAPYTIQVVEGLAGVDISHYAEINFDGFCGVVDAIGGVEVDVPMEIDDDEAGGHLDAGLQTLDGEQALILCRSRHTYDQYGKGDELRAANQRMVLSAIAKKILKSDLPTMISAIQSISKNVTTDFSVSDILSIANTLRDMDPDNDIYTAQMPTTTAIMGGIYYEILDIPAWTQMMKRMDQALPPVEESEVDAETGVKLSSSGGGTGASGTGSGTNANGSGYIAVRNGSNTEGAATAAAKVFESMGYTTDAGNAELHTYTYSMVIYNDASRADEAEKLAAALGVGKAVQNDGTYTIPTGYDFMVVIGSDYKPKQS